MLATDPQILAALAAAFRNSGAGGGGSAQPFGGIVPGMPASWPATVVNVSSTQSEMKRQNLYRVNWIFGLFEPGKFVRVWNLSQKYWFELFELHHELESLAVEALVQLAQRTLGNFARSVIEARGMRENTLKMFSALTEQTRRSLTCFIESSFQAMVEGESANAGNVRGKVNPPR
jgi:hypothetical protein